MISQKKLSELDYLLASFYEDDLTFVERRFFDSLVYFLYLFSECYRRA